MVIVLMFYVADRKLEMRADRTAAHCSRSYTEGGMELFRSYLLMQQLNDK